MTPEGLLEWLASGERGTSSNTMVQHILGIKALNHPFASHPYDPDDFRRCRLLCEQVPEIGRRMDEMKSFSPEWARIVDRWDEICFSMDGEAPDGNWKATHWQAPHTYKLMHGILYPPPADRPGTDEGGK